MQIIVCFIFTRLYITYGYNEKACKTKNWISLTLKKKLPKWCTLCWAVRYKQYRRIRHAPPTRHNNSTHETLSWTELYYHRRPQQKAALYRASKTLTIITYTLTKILTGNLSNAKQNTRTRRWVADWGNEDKMCFHMFILALCLHNEGLHNFVKHYRTIHSRKRASQGKHGENKKCMPLEYLLGRDQLEHFV
jgi:hypothetical protein